MSKQPTPNELRSRIHTLLGEDPEVILEDYRTAYMYFREVKARLEIHKKKEKQVFALRHKQVAKAAREAGEKMSVKEVESVVYASTVYTEWMRELSTLEIECAEWDGLATSVKETLEYMRSKLAFVREESKQHSHHQNVKLDDVK